MKRYNKHIKRYFFLCTLYHLFNTCNIIYLYEKNSKQNLFQVVFFFLNKLSTRC
jgi:hypothetical protein